ncbi:hypothetical protein PYCCODRAFT_1429617 [Trametes coccinea BRFM310]|uniref:Uncharacterized protein n=1 Tax=Trametes coccinea (strain BRFM310) TaxID=1353009 RepID=A0A1Y2J569_TRAC3|nr:hypothetical protein PYCCODRAFT_1429617 [Trametes coccinea BRFM310]
MISLGFRRRAAHPGCKLEWHPAADADADELALAAQELSSADFIIKPNELHLAFDVGPLRSRAHSRFKRLNPRQQASSSKPGPAGNPLQLRRPGAPSRSNTVSSVATLTMTLTADAAVLITRHVRRESTYIVWGGLLAFEPPGAALPLRAVLVKIAVDDEGGEDLRDHARHYEGLAERGLDVGYYGIFGDSIGSTALVVEDLGDDSPRSMSP